MDVPFPRKARDFRVWILDNYNVHSTWRALMEGSYYKEEGGSIGGMYRFDGDDFYDASEVYYDAQHSEDGWVACSTLSPTFLSTASSSSSSPPPLLPTNNYNTGDSWTLSLDNAIMQNPNASFDHIIDMGLHVVYPFLQPQELFFLSLSNRHVYQDVDKHLIKVCKQQMPIDLDTEQGKITISGEHSFSKRAEVADHIVQELDSQGMRVVGTHSLEESSALARQFMLTCNQNDELKVSMDPSMGTSHIAATAIRCQFFHTQEMHGASEDMLAFLDGMKRYNSHDLKSKFARAWICYILSRKVRFLDILSRKVSISKWKVSRRFYRTELTVLRTGLVECIEITDGFMISTSYGETIEIVLTKESRRYPRGRRYPVVGPWV